MQRHHAQAPGGDFPENQLPEVMLITQTINAFEGFFGTFCLSPFQKGCASFQFSNRVPEFMFSLTEKVVVVF